MLYQSKYSMDLISHHSQFSNKILKKYTVDGIETVGAWGDEPFEIKFRNNTYNKVQVKISVDGTDILTGKPASTEIDKNMWVVSGQSTLSLKAWPENNNGGARFVFTNANNSVALHTHGDLSSRGIIAAAVYEEGHVEPIKYYLGDCSWIGAGDDAISYNSTKNSGSIKTFNRRLNKSLQSTPETSQSVYYNSQESKNLANLVSVGAGQHVDQKISYVTGLIDPKFASVVRIRYLWWDELVSKLKESVSSDKYPSGFPGNHKIIDLGNTPRIEDSIKKPQPTVRSSFSRF